MPPAAADARLAHHDPAILQDCFQDHVFICGRVDATGNVQHFRRGLHGVGKIAHDVGQRGKKEIAEAVSFQTASGMEAILEQTRQQGLILRQRHHAVADVARRQHLELAAQATGAAAVIAHRDNGCDVDVWGSGVGLGSRRAGRGRGVVFEPE